MGDGLVGCGRSALYCGDFALTAMVGPELLTDELFMLQQPSLLHLVLEPTTW